MLLSQKISPPWEVRVLTMFPELFPGPLGHSITGRALKQELWRLSTYNIRNFAIDKHGTVDDPPYGGGGGMVLRADVMGKAIEDCFSAAEKNFPIIYLSPRGKLLTQNLVEELVQNRGIQIICGRFEGIDQRVIDTFAIEEISVGDYVLSTGDIAAYSLIDSCVRRIPGVIKQRRASNSLLLEEESLAPNTKYSSLLEYHHYTKPQEWRGQNVPQVLLSGDHAKIDRWRIEIAKKITRERRPDLYKEN